MRHNGLKTQSGNYLVAWKNSYFFINLSLNKLLKESDEGEYEWLANITETIEIEISNELESLLDKASMFITDASNLEYFQNEAKTRIYPFASMDKGEISLYKLSENKHYLLYSPVNSSYNSVAWNGYSENIVRFYNKEKQFIGKCKEEHDCRYAANHVPNSFSHGETVMESITRQGFENQVAYIYHIHENNGDYNNSVIHKSQDIYIVDTDLPKLIQIIREEAENTIN